MAYAAILGQTGSSGILPQITITPINYTYTSVVLQNNETSKQFTATYDGSNWVAQVDEYGTYTITGTYSGGTKTATLDVEVNQEYSVTLGYTPVPTLNDNDWATISYASKNNLGESLWAVGDSKQVTINGNIGTRLNITNTNFYMFIIDFNHQQNYNGLNIAFSGFLNSPTDTTYVRTLTDELYGDFDSNVIFSINHTGQYANTNVGGWASCDIRYDILGSTQTKGDNATPTCTSNPVPNTLMAALPSDLRSVMKPMTVYTDNVGGGSGSVQSNVTATIDYLPLLSEFEVFGTDSYANTYEQNYQARYQYFTNGNPIKRYNTTSTSSGVYWWLRSPVRNSNGTFCVVNASGNMSADNTAFSNGVSPIFIV